jgi:heme exporter protein D
MLDLGPHAAFILWAYAITFAVLGGLIAWVVADARRQKQLIADLETRGITRRASRGTP